MSKVQQATQETIQSSFIKAKGNVIELEYATGDANDEEEKDLSQFRANVWNITFGDYATIAAEFVTRGLRKK